jgi:uncharacterized protein (UPF0218 family)
MVKSGFHVLIWWMVKRTWQFPLHLNSPSGSLVLYGTPGEGLVVCEVDKVINKVKKFKDKLEEQ